MKSGVESSEWSGVVQAQLNRLEDDEAERRIAYRWEYEYGRRYGQRANTALQIANCNNPSAFGWVSALYMISFIVLGALVLL